MEIEPESPKSLPSQRSNMQVLAKHQVSSNMIYPWDGVGRSGGLKQQIGGMEIKPKKKTQVTAFTEE